MALQMGKVLFHPYKWSYGTLFLTGDWGPILYSASSIDKTNVKKGLVFFQDLGIYSSEV